MNLFEVDRKGMAKLFARGGKQFILAELIQNALDADDCRAVCVEIDEQPGGLCRLYVEDDAPGGFKDLSHAYTLFAESEKKVDPEKRGRFNIGEKLVAAVSRSMKVETTTGTVIFKDGVRTMSPSKRTERGTRVTVILKMSRSDVVALEAFSKTIIAPRGGPSLTVNDVLVAPREVLAELSATLQTVVADEDGFLVKRDRKTTVRVYSVAFGELPHIYEMGIPVMQTDMPWHVCVGQKVPLPVDRSAVSPAYMRRLTAAVLNGMHGDLTPDAAAGAWVDAALSSPDLDADATRSVIDHRYGSKRVVRDPSDPEATRIAQSQGYAVVEPGSFSSEQWSNIRKAQAVLPAGKVTPSPKVIFSSQGQPPIPEKDWTPGMVRIANTVKLLANRVQGQTVDVSFYKSFGGQHARACYRSGHVAFNLHLLGEGWVNDPPLLDLIQLIVHELGHRAGDHLDEEYHREICKLAAGAVQLALQEPKLFQELLIEGTGW